MELVACPLCRCILPNSTTQAQYLSHIQVRFYLSTIYILKARLQAKHKDAGEVDVRSALLELAQSKKPKARLLSFPQQTTCKHKVVGVSAPVSHD